MTSGQVWVTLREAETQTGVSVSTLRKWRKRGELESRKEPGRTGERVIVPLAAVAELAAQRGAGRGTALAGSPTAAPPPPGKDEPPTWAIELLARADARAEMLTERLAQAERERADAERDAAIERHKRERAETEAERVAQTERDKRQQAEAEAERLQAELDRLRISPPRRRRWWHRNSGNG